MANQQHNKVPNNAPRGNKPKTAKWLYIVYGVIMLVLLFGMFGSGSGTKKPVDWNKLSLILERHDYESITVINQEVAEIRIKADAIKAYPDLYKDLHTQTITGTEGPAGYYTYNIGNYEHFDKELAIIEAKTGEHISYKIETHTNALRELLVWFGPLLLLLLLFWGMSAYARKQMGGEGGGFGGMFGFGGSRAKQYDATKQVNVTFKDVAGLAGAKEEVMEVVDFLKNPKHYTELGGKIPKGVLLVGPPGTGKTLLAKAVAGEAGVPFFSMSGSDFVEMFVGVGASRVRGLFDEAKKKSPCIVFIDEIDAVGRARGRNGLTGGNDERENTLNQLLTEMDGFSSTTNVIVLAATNRADVLDKALMRAGRFDRQIYVELPEVNEREEIFKVHLRGIKVSKDFDIPLMAKHTPGFSGADIANVCNEAALTAARKNKKEVDTQDFLDAVDRIIGGLERKDNTIMTPAEKRTTAYHEAGHAVVGWLLPEADPVLKVSIIPRGKALGVTWNLPAERKNWSKSYMMDEMCTLMGGRAAEMIVNGEPSTGALSDFERMTNMAYSMVQYYGMSDRIGPMSFYDSTGSRGYELVRPYSEKTAELMDQEVRRIIDEVQARTDRILRENDAAFRQVAELLLDKEVIMNDDLERILGPKVKPASAVEEAAESQDQPESGEGTAHE